MIRNVCLFAHYDGQGLVDAYVLRYLAALRACGFEIVFASTSLLESEREKLTPLCHDVMIRENRGLDFGFWQAAYRKHGALCTGELLLANDSVYGPIGDLSAALDRLRALDADVMGMVESHQHTPHLQSWFVLFNARSQKSEAFQALMNQPFEEMDKKEVIGRGELLLTGAMRDAGFRVAALYPPPGCEPFLRRINPTHTLWQELIEEGGAPFIKVELLRDNPVSIATLGHWRRIVTARSPDLVPLIEGHRNRLSPHWAGRDMAEGEAKILSMQAFVQRALRYKREGKRLEATCNSLVFPMRTLAARAWHYFGYILYGLGLIRRAISRHILRRHYEH